MHLNLLSLQAFYIFVATIMLPGSHQANQQTTPTTTNDTTGEILYGRVKELTERSAAYSSMSVSVTTFTPNGNILRIVDKGDCNCSWNLNYQYDEKGRKKQMIAFGGGIHPDFNQRLFKYDEGGRLIEMSYPTKMLMEDSDNELERVKYIYQYDNEGNCIQTDRFLGKEHQAMYTYKYNNQRFVAEYNVEYNGSRKEQYKYPVVDAKGNWLIKVKISRGDEKSDKTDTTRRKVIYY